jgi:hypothetical protein
MRPRDLFQAEGDLLAAPARREAAILKSVLSIHGVPFKPRLEIPNAD